MSHRARRKRNILLSSLLLLLFSCSSLFVHMPTRETVYTNCKIRYLFKLRFTLIIEFCRLIQTNNCLPAQHFDCTESYMVSRPAKTPQPPRPHLIILLVIVWSKRGNIHKAALVTIAQCNTLVARCSRQLIGPAIGFLSHWDPYAAISLEAVAYS